MQETRDRPRKIPDWLLILGFWAVIAALLLGRTLLQPDRLLLGDGDDAMRMVSALDLLHGQAWTDLMQHRDNTPHGTSMHWSHLIDAPLALIMALAQPFVGDAAPDVAAMVWPVLLMLPLMFLTAAVIRRLVPQGETFTAIVLPVLTLAIVVEFLPGRPDHHNVQILLSLTTLLALLVGRATVLGGAAAGFAIATSLAIGMETLLFLVIGAAAYAICWLLEPERYRLPLASFAGTLALGTAAHFLVATAPANYFVEACDALSIVYVAAVSLGAAALLLSALTGSGLRRMPMRFLLICCLGAVALGATVLLFPDCLRGPYANVDPAVLAYYYRTVGEMQSLFARLATDAPTGIGFATVVMLALPVTAWRAWRETGDRRTDWLILLGFLTAAALVMVTQIRGARIAAPFALPAAAWVITEARRRYLEKRGWQETGMLVGSWLLFAGFVHFAIAGGVALLLHGPVSKAVAAGEATVPAHTACFLSSSYAALAAVPPGRVVARIVLGPSILRFTGHSVVSAGFHRNNAGNLDVAAFFAGDEAAARKIADERGLDYVVLCPGAAAFEGPIGPGDGSTWAWLTPISASKDRLRIFRVKHD